MSAKFGSQSWSEVCQMGSVQHFWFAQPMWGQMKEVKFAINVYDSGMKFQIIV